MTEIAFFQDLAILMAIAGAVAIVFSRYGWPKVLGFIAAGLLMNEHTWGGAFLAQPSSVRIIGQLGVVFLMFAMGLSFSPREMKRIRGVALPAAVIDTVVMIWVGYTLGTRIFGWAPVPSLFLGVAICDSATTLLVKVIEEMGWGKRPFTRYVIGTSICEDIVCVGAVAVATGFAKGGGMSPGAFASSLLGLALFFVSVLVIGFILLPRLLVSVGKRKDDEALVLAVLGACFFISYIAYRSDYSLALGAFLVGILCGSSDIRDRIAVQLDPLKSMFSAVFFVSIGLLVNPVELLRFLPQILIVSTVVLVGKTLNNFIASLVTGLDVKTSVQTALSLAQIGEFAFMVAVLYAGIAGKGQPTGLFPIAVGTSLLTTIINPFLIRASDPIGEMLERRTPERFRSAIITYRAWLDKIGSSANTPEFLLLKTNCIKLGIYAVLMFAVSTVSAMLYKFDYSRFSEFFERHDAVFFFFVANIFSVSLVPLIIAAARALSDEIAVLLAGGGSSKWQVSMKALTRYVVVVIVCALFFLEWTMINIATAPKQLGLSYGVIALIVGVGIAGWRFFLKAGRQATTRFEEALTAEERREGLKATMTITVPEGIIHRFTLEASSPAIGCTIASLNIRAKTGASVMSVYRNGAITRNIGPDWEFAVGDTLVVIGEQPQIAALKDLLGVINQ